MWGGGLIGLIFLAPCWAWRLAAKSDPKEGVTPAY
jgi:hypothetical protein